MAYLFLDESGIHKQGGISCVALVYVEAGDLEEMNSLIIQVEQHIGVDYFHWVDHSWRLRENFLGKIIKGKFLIKSVIIKNPFHGNNYQKALEVMCSGEMSHTLIIDGKKSRDYKRRFKKILRDHDVVLKKLVMANDKSFPVLRLADFCCGLICSYHEKHNSKSKALYKKLEPKISMLGNLIQ